MKITGKKIVSLTEDEMKVLHDAEDLLTDLADEIGNNNFDFADLADSLFYIRTTGTFTADFEG